MNPRTAAPALGCITFQALLLAYTGGSPIIAALCIVAAALAYIANLRFRLDPSVRLAMWVALGASLAMKSQTAPYLNPNEGYLIPGGMSLMLAELFLAAQTLEVFRRDKAGALPMAFACLGVAGTTAIFNRTIDNVERFEFFLLALASAGIAGWGFQATVSRAPIPNEANPERSAYFKRLGVVAGMFAITAVISWTVSTYWTRQIPNVMGWFSRQLSTTARQMELPADYTTTADLHNISAGKIKNPRNVAVRVYVQNQPGAAPGYLRGRAFDYFSRGSWRRASQLTPRTFRDPWSRSMTQHYPLRNPPSGINAPDRHRLFELAPIDQAKLSWMDIHNVPDRGEMYFLPLDTAYVSGRGGVADVDEHGILRDGVQSHTPYRAYYHSGLTFPTPQGEYRRRLTQPVAGLPAEVQRISQRVCGNQPTAKGKMDAVAAYFKNNYQYTLKPFEAREGMDELSWFLLKNPPAHCEFFATGAVALLRLQGVPCRFVTGYVVTELEDEHQEYWLARNKDAHAWVEAYDDATSKWVIVEATPGMTAPDDVQNEAAATNLASLGNAALMDIAHWWEGDWGTFVWNVLWYAAPLFVFGVAAIVLSLSWLRKHNGVDPATRKRLAKLRQMDRLMKRKNFIRNTAETLHQFADRIQANANQDPSLSEAAKWYVDYAMTRYGRT